MDVESSAGRMDVVPVSPSPVPDDQPWRWLTHTAPFSALDDVTVPASFVVEQIGDKDFRLPEGLGFQYNPDGREPIRVTSESLPQTDFASIPRFMSWLVGRHGRHTAAALVHDQLVVPGMFFEDRKRADLSFREMMDALEVPPVLSRVMWAAVTLATRLGDRRARVGIYAWAASAIVGLGLLAAGAVNLEPWLVVVALVGPFAAAALWGSQYWAGVVAGLALPVVALPAAASLLGYWAYWFIERGVKAARQRFKANQAKELPAPVGYQGR